MVSCWSFLCSGLSCLAHTREMFTSLWRSSNHLELSRQPEGPGLRCHLFYYIYIKYIIFTINSINENRCCISILQLWEIAVGHEDVYVHSSLIKKVTPPFNQSSPMNRKWFPILFSVGSLRRCCHPEQSWRENDWYWRERNSLWWRIRLQVRTRNALQHESKQKCVQAQIRDHRRQIRPARLCARHAFGYQGRHLNWAAHSSYPRMVMLSEWFFSLVNWLFEI